VLVECRRMGGGFGGKESQSALFACVAAVAARKLQRPVKLRPDRDDDFMITGRRHGFEFDYAVGYDDAGRVLGAEVTMIANAGFGRPEPAGDDARDLPLRQRLLAARSGDPRLLRKTNTQSNTAFRGFGGPQGALAIEVILDSIARELGSMRCRCGAPTSTARRQTTSRRTARRWSTT
jgi:xanthine dehydrogenase large subunit